MTKKVSGEIVAKLPTHNEAGHVVGTRELITYQGLLAMSHDNGLTEIDTTLLQSPSDANGHIAIVKATARGLPAASARSAMRVRRT